MENKYMMLDRLVQDAKYYVGDMAVSEKHLYYGSVDDQTVAIRKLFNSFTGKPGDEKPEWFTKNQMLELFTKMVQKQMMVEAFNKMNKVVGTLKDMKKWDEVMKAYKKSWKFFYEHSTEDALNALIAEECNEDCNTYRECGGMEE